MKKLLALFLGLGLSSQQALAVMVMGEDFAGYVDTVVGADPHVWVDDLAGGSTVTDPVYSNAAADVNAYMTDTDAGTWVIGDAAGAYLDLRFNTGVVNGNGNDLKIYFIGSSGHTVDLTIGTETQTFSLPSGSGDTGAKDSLFGDFPIVALGVNLDAFSSLTGPVTDFRMTIGDRWCGDASTRGLCSGVPSFVGAYNVVPVPAAVWLFGSGLVALAGIAARKRA